jgi:diguanylate cyclase (GGDEF)-like protein
LSGSTPDEVAAHTVSALRELFRASWAAFYRFSRDGDVMRSALTGVAAGELPEHVIGRAAAMLREAEGTPILRGRSERGIGAFDKAAAAAPVEEGEERLGWLVIGEPAGDRLLGREDAELLALVGQIIAPRLAYTDMLAEQTRASLIDAGTGLSNRRAFDERIAEELARSNRSGQPLALVICEVDQVERRRTPDAHGEANRALLAAVEALKQSIRLSDPAFRVGDWTIAALLVRSGPQGGLVVGERVRRVLERTAIERTGAPTTVSIGVAALREGVVHSPTSLAALALVRKADEALRQAKALGGNRVVLGR